MVLRSVHRLPAQYSANCAKSIRYALTFFETEFCWIGSKPKFNVFHLFLPKRFPILYLETQSLLVLKRKIESYICCHVIELRKHIAGRSVLVYACDNGWGIYPSATAWKFVPILWKRRMQKCGASFCGIQMILIWLPIPPESRWNSNWESQRPGAYIRHERA